MQPGTRIAHYEVLGVIGRGGMGEVYRARDSKLKRDVALKTLSAEFAADAERVARLEREATVIAALNHPHIGAIHGIEDHDGGKVLVLELVDGQTLADRLRRAPLRIEPALRTALQIASAIESAHDRGVIHRDLKPDNIAFTRDGHVKVLDFGLAKSVAPAERNQATATVAHTELGTTSGTAPYMSPEQARGEPTDRQTDIWAFGVTLYEMLTGISPFERKSSTETLARVLESEPDWAQLPAATPPSARRLLRRCLEKDRKRRFRDMADVRIEIEDALAALGTEPAAAPRGAGGLRAVAAAAVGVALLALVGFGTWSLMRAPAGAPAQVVRLSIPGMERPIAFPFGTQDLAISPNGSQIALAGQARINLRRLSDSKVSNIEIIQPNPFFSPDGAWLGAGNVARVPVTGGTPSWIFENTERPAGAAWGSDGTIVSATTSGLYRVDANGGEQQLLAQPRTELGELLYAWPQLLPGGTGVLFTIVMRGSIDGAQIAWLDLRTLETRVVLTGGTSPRYTRTGHLVYAAGQRLWAVPFDPVTGTTSGEPVEIPDVAVSTRADNGAALFAIADNGTLAFVEPEAQRQESRRVLVWVDREGTEQRLSAQALQYNYARVSPDGSRIALDISGANRDIWIWDVSRESLTRLSDGPNEDLLPLWSRDGRRVYFGSARNGNVDIFSQAADASTRARMELEDPRFHLPQSISADGRYLIVGQDQRDLSVFDLAQSQLEPLLQSDAKEWVSDLSPNGRWLAYDSDESGQFEVYLRPFPNVSEGREVVSIGGGGYPQWDPSGSGELYYIDADGAMMAVQVGEGPPQPIGKPAKLFQFAPRVTFGASARPYDVGKDGRFLLVRTDTSELPEPVTVTVILNWFESLRAQVPIAAR